MPNQPSTEQPMPMEKLQVELTKTALELAQEIFNIKLQFDHESIKKVEEMLAAFHREYKKSKEDDGWSGIAIEFGAYIITTIEKNTEKGRWERDHPQFGEASFPFYWRDSTIFPYEWCRKRIFDGEADNVWYKYQALVLKKIDGTESKRSLKDLLFKKNK